MAGFEILGEIRQMDAFNIERHRKSENPDYPHQYTGEYPLPFPPPEVFEESLKLGLFSGFRIGQNFRAGKLADLEKLEHGLIHIDLLRSTIDYQRPGEALPGESYEAYARRYMNELFDFALRHPQRTILCAIGEFDSSCCWPHDRAFATREEAYQFFKHCCEHVKIGSGDPESIYQTLQQRQLTLNDVRMMIHGACLFAIHYYFEWGFPHVEIERGIGSSCNMQVSLGYLRGAWKQYGRKAQWGIDYSTHHPNFNQCNWYDQNGKRCGGRSESLIMRQWLASWLGGADYLLCEGSDYTHWYYQPDGSIALSKLGEEAVRFANLTLHSCIDRGTPCTPVAIMLNYYNGFEENNGTNRKGAFAWGGRYPLSATDLHIGNLFEAFSPGHRQANHDADCALADEPLPWRTQQEYRKLLLAGFDMRPWEKGFLVPTPVGDCVDVLLDNAETNVLHEYPVLILAGEAKPQAEKLLSFMENGGCLIAAINQLPDTLREALKMKVLPGTAKDWDYDEIQLVGQNFHCDGRRYAFARLEIPGSRILGYNHRQIPLFFKVPFGLGQLLLSAIPCGQDLPGLSLIPAWERLILDEAARHFPLYTSKPGLEICLNRTGSGWLVAAFNHHQEPWEGSLVFRDATPCQAELLHAEQNTQTPESMPWPAAGLQLQLLPFETKILRTTPSIN